MHHCKDCGFSCGLARQDNEAYTDYLSLNVREVHYKKDETLIKQDTFIHSVFYLKSGLAKLVIEVDKSKNFIVRLLSTGAFLGLSSVWFKETYPYTIVTVKPSVVCTLKVNVLQKISRADEGSVQLLMDKFTDDIHFNYQKLAMIGTRQMHGRLAEILLYLSGNEFQVENVFQYLSRKDMADLSGMSIESMNRILNELKNDRIIEIQGKQIIIKDKELLKRLSRVG